MCVEYLTVRFSYATNTGVIFIRTSLCLVILSTLEKIDNGEMIYDYHVIDNEDLM
jgi:hypothetical protein